MYDLTEFKVAPPPLMPVIASQDDFASAGDLLKWGKNKVAIIEEKRKSYTDPLFRQQKLIKSDFDKIAEPYVKFIDELETKMKQFYVEEKKRVDAEQLRLDNDVRSKAGSAGALVPIINSISTIRGDFATSTVRNLTRWRLVNIGEVPREFLCVDEKKIKAWIEEGKACPSGLQYFEELSITSR